MLKALGSVFKDVKFMPTGGVSAGNLAEYLALPQVLACGGSWLTPKSAIAEKPVEMRTPSKAAAGAVGTGLVPGARAFRREALDAVKKSAGYDIQQCACGAKIKIPKGYPKRDKIKCLSCGRKLGEK